VRSGTRTPPTRPTSFRFLRGQNGKAAEVNAELMARSRRLLEEANNDIDAKLIALKTTREGLTEVEADDRLVKYGPNEVAHERPPTWHIQFLSTFRNPFIVVLVVLAIVSLVTSPDDLIGPTIIGVMIAVSVVIRFWQEFRSTRAAEKLKAMVSTKATVIRRRPVEDEISSLTAEMIGVNLRRLAPQQRELPLRELVPGDIVALAAGDMIPADVRLLTSKDLFVSQAVLTGESMPVEKYDTLAGVVEKRAMATIDKPAGMLDLPNVCFMGTNVISGSGTALVLATGSHTYFGSLSKGILRHRPMTSFDKGINRVTWLLVRFMVIMVPVVLLINGFTKHDWKNAFFFALSVAVGLTPEMLPLIVTANLARGAIVMSRQKVIIKRLNAIQNFGAMDVLCTDKTGTLTQDRVILEQHLDVIGRNSHDTLRLAYLNSRHQTGLKNLLDRAVLQHAEMHLEEDRLDHYRKVDEIPFDFMRRRMSVVVQTDEGKHLLVCKGAVDEIFRACSQVKIGPEIGSINEQIRKHVVRVTNEMNAEGMRVVAVAYKELPPDKITYAVNDERELILTGYVGFLDPPKESSAQAMKALHHHGVMVKVLTGDNDVVTRKICKDVDLAIENVALGPDIEKLSEEELAELTERTTVFAKLNPLQKARVIRSLKSRGHTVGYLGDGINDAPALRDADVGISVDTAVDIAKESADIILLEKNLLVLEKGVIEGRTTFGNIVKYIKMTASSNFGNVLSVLIASAFIPFLPMLAIQLLVNNLLYDLSQLSIPWDRMDEEFLVKPRKWDASSLRNFMIIIGPISSIFDITTFLLMWYVFKANSQARQSLFQSAWFIESLFSQTLIVHMIRTQKIPFIQSTAAAPVVLLTSVIMAFGLWVPFSPISHALGMVSLPWSFFPWLIATLIGYCMLTQVIKVWYIREFKSWL